MVSFVANRLIRAPLGSNKVQTWNSNTFNMEILISNATKVKSLV